MSREVVIEERISDDGKSLEYLINTGEEGECIEWVNYDQVSNKRQLEPLKHLYGNGNQRESSIRILETAATPSQIEQHAEENGESNSSTNVFEVESIQNHTRKGNKVFYLVRWKGYKHRDSTWEPEANLFGCTELLQEYKLLANLE